LLSCKEAKDLNSRLSVIKKDKIYSQKEIQMAQKPRGKLVLLILMVVIGTAAGTWALLAGMDSPKKAPSPEPKSNTKGNIILEIRPPNATINKSKEA